MKKFLVWLMTVGILCTILFYKEEIISYLLIEVIYPRNFVVNEPNEYYIPNDYEFVQKTDDFTPSNKQELLNIFYTILNYGWDNFSFVCERDYTECASDIRWIMNEPFLLSDINNFVHPYNNYETIEINANNFGKVDVSIVKLYSDAEIKIINSEIDRIYNELIHENMTDKEKIRTIHDYIINTTKYVLEEEADESGEPIYPLHTNTAYGPLLNHVGSCGGYTDAMALFLNKMNIPNYKISSEQHIWNLVYIDGTWKHLDLTWDDPVTTNGTDILEHNFFLITSRELAQKNVEEHEYNNSIFSEAKEGLSGNE